MKKLNKRGFTIVELVVVIAVIAILAGVLIPSLSGVVTGAKEKAALENVKNAYTATFVDANTDSSSTKETSQATITALETSTDGLIVKCGDFNVKLSKNVEATIATTGSATYEIKDGRIVLISNT